MNAVSESLLRLNRPLPETGLRHRLTVYKDYHWSLYVAGVGILAAIVVLINGIVLGLPMFLYQGVVFLITSSVAFYTSRKISLLDGLTTTNEKLKNQVDDQQKQVLKLSEIEKKIKSNLIEEQRQHNQHIADLKALHSITEDKLLKEEKKCQELKRSIQELEQLIKNVNHDSDENIGKMKLIFKSKDGLNKQIKTLSQENLQLKELVKDYGNMEVKLQADIANLQKNNKNLSEMIQNLELENVETQKLLVQSESQQHEMQELMKFTKTMLAKTDLLANKVNKHCEKIKKGL